MSNCKYPACIALAAAVVVSPALAGPDDWSSPSTGGPAGMCCVGIAYQESNHDTVLFGGAEGFPNFTAHGETWELGVGGWIQRFPKSAPSPRSGPGMAYDAATGSVVLFGGTANGIDYGDTWIWDGEDWTEVFPFQSPPPRSFETNSMAYSPAGQYVVMFGGITSSLQLLGDTWTWNGLTQTWTQQTTPPALTPRRAPLARDASGNILLFGGDNYPNGAFGDTWIWNASANSGMGAWEQRHPVGSTPGPRGLASTAYDPVRHAVVLFGGAEGNQALSDAWVWKSGAWTQVKTSTVPPVRFAFGMDYDPRAQGVLIFGGYGALYAYDDLWILESDIGPGLNVTPASINFGDQVGHAYETLTLTNNGPTDVTGIQYFLAAYSGGSFGMGTTGTSCGATLASGASCSIQVGFTPGAVAGIATLTISSPSGGALSVPMTGNSAVGPLTLSQFFLTFTARVGGGAPPAQTVAVSSKATPLTFTLSQLSGTQWHGPNVTVSGGTTPATLTVSVDPTGLAVGSYGSEIWVASPGAVNSPQAFLVTFNVTP